MTSPLTTAGFVLAGGRSSRMGSEKALALFGGVPLIEVALRTFTEAGIAARIAGSRSPLAEFADQLPDRFADSGPLGGIHAALTASSAEWNVFLPVDMPLMPSSLLSCMIRRAQLTGEPVTVTRLNGFLQPFPVVLSRCVLSLVERRIQAGQTACHCAWQTVPQELSASLDDVSVEALLQCGHCRHPAGLPPLFWFESANTPAELERLHRYAAA